MNSSLTRTCKELIEISTLKLRLITRGDRKAIAFDLAYMGELQFIEPVLRLFAERNPEDIIILVHNGNTVDSFNRSVPSLRGRLIHIQSKALQRALFREIDLFITSEEYDLGIDGVYSISISHGHPAKGIQFVPEIVRTFDAFFLVGPMHRQSFDEFVQEFMDGKYPEYLELFNIGYPKSDNLLNGKYASKVILEQLSLDAGKRTILYAPAFNEGASLRLYGPEIIEILAGLRDYNVIAKLPIDCYQPTDNFYATGGIDWFEVFSDLQNRYGNVRLYNDYLIDPLLECADVLITCISSVSFEFLALNKPVIFIDTPQYFRGYLKRRFPDKDTVSWANRTTVNGGHEFGLVVSNIHELPEAISTVLSNPQDYPRQRDILKTYLLYNPGKGTEAAVSKIEDLLATNVKTKRPYANPKLLRTLISAGFDRFFRNPIKSAIMKSLYARGYTIKRTGGGYMDPKETIKAASAENLSICEYLEGTETDKRNAGRRNRIIEQMKKRGIFESCGNILEIGTGTGMYLEKVLEEASPKRYEIYETHPEWVKYLRDAFVNKCQCNIIIRNADGEHLSETDDASCKLVHAHGVFVYIPFLNTCSYIKEASRILAPGGYLLFDCYLDSSFGYCDIQSWLNGPWRFPVILPESTLIEYSRTYGLEFVDSFRERYCSSFVDYLLFRKEPFFFRKSN